MSAGHWRRKRLALWIVGALALGWVLSSFLVGFVLSRRFGGPQVELRPAPSGIDVADVRLTTVDGEQIGAWLFQADAPGASIVLLHGWHGSRTAQAGMADALARRGFAVLALSLRAHGDSSGSEYDFGLDARQDVIAAVGELERRRPGRPIAVIGCSYGAAAAAFAGEELGPRVSAYVFDSLFADVESAVHNRCALFLPVVLDDLAWWGLRMAAPIVFPRLGRMDSVRACRALPRGIPVLLARGTLDCRVLPAETVRLGEALQGHVELAEWAGADHDRGFAHDPERWLATVDAFLRRATR